MLRHPAWLPQSQISIHAPHARSDLPGVLYDRSMLISIHAPHARSDVICAPHARTAYQFQSTLLMRGATFFRWPIHLLDEISIHAPHARSDVSRRAVPCTGHHFNPRSSCEERHAAKTSETNAAEFQSTLLMRGATSGSRPCRPQRNFNPRSSCEERLAAAILHRCAEDDFNPRSSCEERLGKAIRDKQKLQFQSTLLMRGATKGGENSMSKSVKFQSTLLMRGATSSPTSVVKVWSISIHAPHARSDQASQLFLLSACDFNPRSSCEERPEKVCGSMLNSSDFNPRSSCEERLVDEFALTDDIDISIHAPHARSDHTL